MIFLLKDIEKKCFMLPQPSCNCGKTRRILQRPSHFPGPQLRSDATVQPSSTVLCGLDTLWKTNAITHGEWCLCSQHLGLPPHSICHIVQKTSSFVLFFYQTEFWGGGSALVTAVPPSPADRLRHWGKGTRKQFPLPLRFFPLWWASGVATAFKFSRTQMFPYNWAPCSVIRGS